MDVLDHVRARQHQQVVVALQVAFVIAAKRVAAEVGLLEARAAGSSCPSRRRARGSARAAARRAARARGGNWLGCIEAASGEFRIIISALKHKSISDRLLSATSEPYQRIQSPVWRTHSASVALVMPWATTQLSRSLSPDPEPDHQQTVGEAASHSPRRARPRRRSSRRRPRRASRRRAGRRAPSSRGAPSPMGSSEPAWRASSHWTAPRSTRPRNSFSSKTATIVDEAASAPRTPLAPRPLRPPRRTGP